MSDIDGTTQDDKLMSALAHGSVILPFMGIIAPIVIWATQKDKSDYIAFQALQAVAYQVAMLIAWFVCIGCYIGSFLITIVTSFLGIALTSFAGGMGEDNPVAIIFTMLLTMLPGFLPFLVFGLIILGALAFVTYGLAGAVISLQGKDFRYILIGKRVERYLQQH
jgi:uncharacterized Tic20 family protein